MTGGPVAALARAVAATSWPDSPAAVRDRVADLVADCVAVAALGSGRPELVRLVEEHAVAPEGASTVVGSARGWPSSVAAFLNASAAAADQLQDGHRLARGHPASHVVPAVLALAEERDADGSEALSAALAGYEAGVRIGRAMGGTPDGVHDIGTWGQVAVSAAVARLLAPGDAAAARRALELSAAAVLLTDAATVFAGRTGSHVFLGASVQLGTSLGIAAVAGLEPGAGSLDRHLGAVAARAWDPEVLGVDGRWGGHEVLGGYVKAHPTCAHLHGVNDAVADLLDQGVRGGDVRDVEVRVSAGAAAFAAVADGELAARFSVPTSVAVALVTGRLDETTMTDATVTSPDVVDLARRVRVVHDPALDEGYPAGRPARVRVVLADGSERSASADRPRGDADRAFSRAELAGKAGRLLTARFGTSGGDVLSAVHALAVGGRARDVGTALRRAARGIR
ncbi:MmgE/PrpD family protein [Blastococcus deserti]|uniref:MmgE/PrpD family protein n=1 Tax=Blastococcus deserti TaxID=2259033 RepID=A0ABW4XDU9_9ACTN